MYNYRRVYINSAKFSRISKDLYLPFMVNTRSIYLFFVTLIMTSLISYVLGWFRLEHLSLGVGLIIGAQTLVYYLDQKLKKDNLPFETTLRYLMTYVWRFWLKKYQLYQGKRVNTNARQYMIL